MTSEGGGPSDGDPTPRAYPTPVWPSHWPAPDGATELIAPRPALGLGQLTMSAASLLSLEEPATPCLVGPRGSGRTAALAALAELIVVDRAVSALSALPIVRVRAEAILGQSRGNSLRVIKGYAAGEAILALDDLEVVLGLSSPAVDLDLRGVVRSLVAQPDTLTIATLDVAYLGRLQAEEPELASKLERLEMPTLTAAQLLAIGTEHRDRYEHHHDVVLPDEVISDAARPATADDEVAHPGLMLARLDRACIQARIRRAPTVARRDLALGDHAPTWRSIDSVALAQRLRARVRGQGNAIDRVCRRVGLTSAGLDLSPHRPNGVFLLVGPTGVGKTELAKALVDEVFGGDDLLIRLDMSEYAEDWAISRLFGPHPGYKGSDEPAGWFTSKVMAKPTSVVLLDEIEKAHPTVWNVFLQVFDDGRLTDSRGRTASFADTVVIMTSNLGARAFSANPVGFGEQADQLRSAEADVRASIERTLPPELINRIDDVILFRPLVPEVIAEIARLEIGVVTDQLATRGWVLAIPPDVIDHLAAEGYDPTYGARHLERNIERHVLEPLVGRTPGSWAAALDGGVVVWTEAA